MFPESVIDATAGVLLLHEPPLTALVRVVVPPTHICMAPAISDGDGVTVTTTVRAQPDAFV